MNILIIGASGAIGSRILNEAVSRGHVMTAVSRTSQPTTDSDQVHYVQADVTDIKTVAQLAANQDALVSSTSPRAKGGKEQYLESIKGVLAVAKQANIPNLLIVGGAASLEIAPGKTKLDMLLEKFSREQMAEPIAVLEARSLILASDVNWTFLCPAGTIEPGQRSGHYRLGEMQAVVAEDGKSYISMEDFAVAVLDELEHPKHQRRQFNAGY